MLRPLPLTMLPLDGPEGGVCGPGGGDPGFSEEGWSQQVCWLSPITTQNTDATRSLRTGSLQLTGSEVLDHTSPLAAGHPL